MLRCLLSFLAIFSWACTSAQGPSEVNLDTGHILVTVHMEGAGFKCPFLTPQVMDILETRSHWVRSIPGESAIQYAQPLQGAWSSEDIADVLESVGYPAGGATFLQWDTLFVVPQMPEP